MKVRLSKFDQLSDSLYVVHNEVICALGDTTVAVRQSTDGTCMIVQIRGGKTTMEPRAAAIHIVVKGA